MEDSDLILDFEESEKHYDLATKGQRFANYIIDQIGTGVLGLLSGFGLAVGDDLVGTGSSAETILSYLIGFIIGLIYFSALEHFTGKTLGKMITKTKVLTESGEKPSFMNILGRTLCRFIPFEPFSFLFGDDPKGWHDTISKTIVVQE